MRRRRALSVGGCMMGWMLYVITAWNCTGVGREGEMPREMSKELHRLTMYMGRVGEAYRKPKHWDALMREASSFGLILQSEHVRGERKRWFIDKLTVWGK
jgi:hypothetical protein